MLRIAGSSYKAIRMHASEAYPHECCGVLLGFAEQHGWHITAAIPAENASSETTLNHYTIAPADLIRIEREARRQGLEIVGFYHSHPDHPAHWSATDLAEAHWLGCIYLITSVRQGKADETNAFLLDGKSEDDKRFEVETIAVE